MNYARFDLFDIWVPVLAPSRKLLRWAKDKEWSAQTRRTFFVRYAWEMEANTDSRQVIQLVAKVARRLPSMRRVLLRERTSLSPFGVA